MNPWTAAGGVHGPQSHRREQLYAGRRVLHPGVDLLAEKQQDQLAGLFAADEHIEYYSRVYFRFDRRFGRTSTLKPVDHDG